MSSPMATVSTPHFAPWLQSYVAIDRRLSHHGPDLSSVVTPETGRPPDTVDHAVVVGRPRHATGGLPPPRFSGSRHGRRWPLLASAAALATLALATALGLRWLTADLPAPGQLLTRAAPDTTKIYDRQGRLLFEVLDPRAGRRTRVPLADVPPVLRQAVIAVEGEGFFRNPGVDAMIDTASVRRPTHEPNDVDLATHSDPKLQENRRFSCADSITA